MTFRIGMTLVLVTGLLASGCGGGDKKASGGSSSSADSAQAVQADAGTKAKVRTATTEMEACYVDASSYAGCKPTTAGVEVSDVTDATYTLTGKSASGNSFVIAKSDTGLDRTCTTKGSGGCEADGTW